MSGLVDTGLPRIAGHDGKLRKLPPATLVFRLRLAPERRGLVADAPSPSALLLRLREQNLLWDQAALLSYALPEREAVWWACMCVLHTARSLDAAQTSAMALAEDWVRQPDECKRIACRQAARQAGVASGPGYVARAVFWACLADPAATRAGRLVEAAVRRAAGEPAIADARLTRFIGAGEAIAAGGSGRLPPEQAGA